MNQNRNQCKNEQFVKSAYGTEVNQIMSKFSQKMSQIQEIFVSENCHGIVWSPSQQSDM